MRVAYSGAQEGNGVSRLTVHFSPLSLYYVTQFHLTSCLSCCSVNFNADSSLLCAASDHATVHVFALDDVQRSGGKG